MRRMKGEERDNKNHGGKRNARRILRGKD